MKGHDRTTAREKARRELQARGLRPASNTMTEKKITTNVGINTHLKKVVVEFSIPLNHLLMDPANAIETARHILLAAEHLMPDAPWPAKTDPKPATITEGAGG